MGRGGETEFVAFFRSGWAIGATDPERFYAHIASRLAPGAAMIQPLARTTYFDPLPLAGALLRSPLAARRLLPAIVRRRATVGR